MTKVTSKDWRTVRKYLFDNQTWLIFLTKHRGEVLSGEILVRLKQIFEQTCQQMKCELLKFEGQGDYVQLLVSIHPTLSISTLVGKLKGKSSYIVVREFPSLKDKIKGNHFWFQSYAAISEKENFSHILKEFLKRT